MTTFLSMAAAIGLLISALLTVRRKMFDMRAKLIGTRQDLLRQFREAEYFRVASENANDGIVILTLDGVIRWCNSAYLKIMLRKREEVIGRNPLAFAIPDRERPTDEEIRRFRYNPADWTQRRMEVRRNIRGDGTEFWVQLSVSFRKTAQEAEYAILIVRDVTEQIDQQEELNRAYAKMEVQARQDVLTGILNRRAFMDDLEADLAGPSKGHIGLIHFDLDMFKEVNDTHGHAAGDATLIRVADILRQETPAGSLLSRFGGDEFLVRVIDTDLDALASLAQRVIDRIGKVFGWKDRLLSVGASAGVAIGTPGETSSEQLLVETDFALYEAKKAGRGRCVKFDRAMAIQQSSRARRAEELFDAIDTDSLEHHFQPITDSDGLTVIGFESLVRWDHPEEGLIPPDQFLPLAIDLGVLGDLDLSSMAKALRQKQRLALAGFPDARISFNASPQLLHHPEFLPTLIRAVEIGRLERSQIIIEVLETTVFGDAAEAVTSAAAIHDLRDAGFHIHLDDFGTGYAGLAHLASLAVTGIKIDRTLVGSIFEKPASAKIAQKIIELGRDLGMHVTAEGVEDKHTAYWLSRVGCSSLQGYWISPPLPQDKVIPWLQARGDGTPPLQLVAP